MVWAVTYRCRRAPPSELLTCRPSGTYRSAGDRGSASASPLRGFSGSGALLGGALAAGQIESGVDQCHMRERLRKVADLAPEARVEFFCQEADIIAQR